MLFDLNDHEPLTSSPWDEAAARTTIAAIVEDCKASLRDDATWPDHPRDVAETTHRTLYMGAAGVACALRYLAASGAASPGHDYGDLLERIHADYLREPEYGEPLPTLLLGEVGILLARYRARPDAAIAERLKAAIRENLGNPARELMWGVPGTMVAALHMLDWTGDDSFRVLYLESAEDLWSSWQYDEDLGCHIWTQDLYGSERRFLGAVHGTFGNIYALLRGAHLLEDARREELYARTVDCADRTALRDGDLVNWVRVLGGSKPNCVQWCHGAPGMVTALADYPKGRDARMEELLLAAGRLTWRAGPLRKGVGLCHGTGGNGYAFLKLFRRTGDPAWLERARAFASHACGQYRALWQQDGRGRFSLWTGDPGLAVYLWHCIRGESDLPSLDAY